MPSYFAASILPVERRLFVGDGLAARVVRVVLGAAVLAGASRCTVPFVATVVPFTLQPQAVLALAATLGGVEATAAVFTWFAAALLGLPVFAGPVANGVALLGPTAGYLLSYPFVAAWVGQNGRGHGPAALFCWGLGALCTLTMGTGWLALWVGGKVAWATGFVPFVVGDASKGLGLFVARRLLFQAGAKARPAA